jgi:hypothetical protein
MWLANGSNVVINQISYSGMPQVCNFEILSKVIEVIIVRKIRSCVCALDGIGQRKKE